MSNIKRQAAGTKIAGRSAGGEFAAHERADAVFDDGADLGWEQTHPDYMNAMAELEDVLATEYPGVREIVIDEYVNDDPDEERESRLYILQLKEADGTVVADGTVDDNWVNFLDRHQTLHALIDKNYDEYMKWKIDGDTHSFSIRPVGPRLEEKARLESERKRLTEEFRTDYGLHSEDMLVLKEIYEADKERKQWGPQAEANFRDMLDNLENSNFHSEYAEFVAIRNRQLINDGREDEVTDWHSTMRSADSTDEERAIAKQHLAKHPFWGDRLDELDKYRSKRNPFDTSLYGGSQEW